jgi:hypothetical protein
MPTQNTLGRANRGETIQRPDTHTRSPHASLFLSPTENDTFLSDGERFGLSRLCERCELRPRAGKHGRFCMVCRSEMAAVRVARPVLSVSRGRKPRFRPGHDAKYGSEHRRARLAVKPAVEAGLATCARCGLPILGWQEWDLGHVDGDSSRYAGPEHARAADCPLGGNRATGRRDRRALRAAKS